MSRNSANMTAVSQFTLLASMKKGNKPDFHQSASGDKARTLYQAFFKKVGALYETDKVKDGLFAAMMDVSLVNDGPVGLDYSCRTASSWNVPVCVPHRASTANR
jgi:D-tyrosyl-tRNA(Tyr) deacylase